MAETAPAATGEPKPAGEPPPAAAPAQPPQPETPPAETVPAPETAKGPIPYDRHESILKNARTKTETEVTQRFQQQYGPHVELGNRIQADPVGTIVGLIEGLASHPEHGPAVISALARTLGSRRSQAVEDQEPQADLQTPDGTLVYSAPQLAKREAWVRKQLDASIEQRLQPLQQREQQQIARERQTEAVKAANDRMAKVLEPYKALPEFEANKPAIRAKAEALMGEGHSAETALGLAVVQVLREVVMPSRAAQSSQQLLADAVKKATGSTSAPGTAAPAPAGRPKDLHDAFSRIAM